MTAIRIRTTLTSDTPHLPELAPLVGRRVEITVAEDPSPEIRDEFSAELDRLPATDAEFAARQDTLRRWRADPRFAVYWPQVDFLLTRDLAHYRRWAAAHEAARLLREDGGYDFDARRVQREIDLNHAGDRAP